MDRVLFVVCVHTSNGVNEFAIDQQLALDFVCNLTVVYLLELRSCSRCNNSRPEGPREVV